MEHRIDQIPRMSMIEQNDKNCKDIIINGSASPELYSWLGASIAKNTRLQKLEIKLKQDSSSLDVANYREILVGIKQNASIEKLHIDFGNMTVVGGVEHKVLQAYEENPSNLVEILIKHAILQKGGDTLSPGDSIISLLRRCTNLTTIIIQGCNLTGSQLLPMVEAMKENSSLRYLDLNSNRIGISGCKILASLFGDTKCHIKALDIGGNEIGNEGVITLVDSLVNNTQQ